MKVHLLNKNPERSFSFFRMNPILFLLIILMVGVKVTLWAEGSKDFIDYPGHRLWLDAKKDQQLKVYVQEGETINVGASHVGLGGGFIQLISPDQDTTITFNNTGGSTGLAIIYNDTQEKNGPIGVNSSPADPGYVPGTYTVPVGNPARAGIWTVVIRYNDNSSQASFPTLDNDAPWDRDTHQAPFLNRVILAWDITVTTGGAGNSGGTPEEGRVYANEYSSLLSGNSVGISQVRTTSPSFYVLTEDGYLYRVNISEADPFRFPISSNSLGLVTGDGNPIYKSWHEPDYTRTAVDPSTWDTTQVYLWEPQARDTGTLINNKVFFNMPDTLDFPSFATVTDVFKNTGTHDTWLYDGRETLVLNSVSLVAAPDNGPPCAPNFLEFAKGGFFVFETNLGGVVTLQLDLNGNHIYTDPVDTTIVGTLDEGIDSIFWDGFDGLGNPIAVQDSFQINYQGTIRFGELHIALADVEALNGGVTFKWLNPLPTSDSDSVWYYDHSPIGGPISGGGPIPDTTSVQYSYPFPEGNDDYVDQWFFIEQPFGEDSIFVNIVDSCFACVAANTPDINVDGGSVCLGEELTLEAYNQNVQLTDLIDYSWSTTSPNNFTYDDPDVPPTDTSFALVSNNATTNDEGVYTVIGTTSGMCADTVSIQVSLLPTPVLESDSSNVQVCENDDVQLCATNITAGIGQMTCTWAGPNGFDDQGTVNGNDQICIDLTNVSQSFEGEYTLVCINEDNGCASDTFTFNLDVQPAPEITGATPNGNYCEGEDVVLTASNANLGTGPIIYKWVGPNGDTLVIDTSFNENGPFNFTIQNIQLSDAGDYVLTLCTFAGCISAPQTVTISVDPVPVICNVSGGGDACVGQTVTLSGSNCATGLTGPIEYVWIGPGGGQLCSGIADNDGPYECEITNIQQNQSGTYCLTLIDQGTECSTEEFCVDVNVELGIIINEVTPDSSYCEGTDVILTATTDFGSDIIYTWTGPNGFFCTDTIGPMNPLTCTINSITAGGAGEYILNAVSLEGCVLDPPDTVLVGVLDGITITSVGGGGTFCVGDTVMLTGTGESNAAMVEYVWTDPSGDTIAISTVPPAGPYDATPQDPVEEGTYTLTVTTIPDGCTDTETVTIEFSETPVANITLPTTDTALCQLDSLILCAQNTNPNIGNFTYTWTTPSGGPITGAGSGTDEFCDELDPINTFGEGTYTLIICAGNCCSDPVSINISLNPNPVIEIVSGGGTYCEGDTALVCFTNTNPAVSDWFYTCNVDTIQTTGMGTGTDTICLEVTSSTFIFCSLESTDGCVSDLEGIQVTFEPNFTPEITVDSVICANDTLALNGSNPSTCTGTVTYTWTGPNGIVFEGTAPCEGPFPATDPNPVTGEYCLDLDDGTGSDCSEPACTTVTVLQLPFVVGDSISGGGDYCEGDMVELFATIENPSGGDIDYEWTQDGNVIASGTAASGTTLTLDLSPIGLDSAGNYCLNLTCVDTGCSDEGVGCTQVNVDPTPIIDAVTGGGTYCQGFDVMLDGSGPVEAGNVTYTWTGPNGFIFTGTAPCGGPYPVTIDSIDVDQAGIYSLVVMKGMCTSDSAHVVVEVNPTPVITNTSGGGAECEGATTTVSFTIDPNGADTAFWTLSCPPLIDTSGFVTVSTDFDFDIVVDGDITCTITAVSNLGCEANPETISITEINIPPPPIFADPDMPCPGETITLSTTSEPGATFTWCLDGTAIGGPSTDTFLVVTDPAAGSYTVKITSMGCTEESASFVLSFPPSPVANDDSFTTDAGVPVSGNILSNDNPSSGVPISVVSPPANGSVIVDADGEMTYTPNTGFSGTDQFTYQICSVICEEDCDEAIVTIVVNVPPCEVPNIITPNGDEVNDILIIDCVPAFPNNRLRIFNRWGDEIEVFEPYTNTWDGTIGSGKDPVPAGTYFYLFQEDRTTDEHKAGYIKVVR